MKTAIVVCLSAVLLTACARAPENSALSESAAPTVVFNTEIPTAEVMAHVINPSAYAFWGSAGVSLTLKGEEDLSPRTPQEWEKVENGAAAVVLASNVLLLKDYQQSPQLDWIKYAKSLGDVAMRAKQAAEHEDKAALWTIGEELDAACDACHNQFLRPASAQGAAK